MKKMSDMKAKTITIGGLLGMAVVATLGQPLFTYSTPIIFAGCSALSLKVLLGSEKSER